MNIDVLKDLTYGMYVVSSNYNGKDVGCIVNTVTQVTAEDAAICVSINKENYTNEAIRENKEFVISILSTKTNPEVIKKFGFFSSNKIDKFDGFKSTVCENIKLLDENICGYILCEVISVISVGTHDLFIAKVKNTVKTNDLEPMTYKYYHEVIKGKSPKKAPTYIEERTSDLDKGSKYKCNICGYVYDEEKEGLPFDKLPDNWKCPI